MTGFQELEGQLFAAIERKAPRRASRVSGLLLAASSVVVLAVAAFAVVALGRHGPPSPPGQPAAAGASQRRRARAYLDATIETMLKRDPACRLGAPPNPAGATLSDGSPSATMLSVLGVLRRPATAADGLPGSLTRARRFILTRGATSVYVRYIRRARVVDGVSYYVIPAAGVRRPAFPGRCFGEEMQTLRREVSRAPAQMRLITLNLGARRFSVEQALGARERGHEGVFELEWQSTGGGGGGGGISPSMLARHGMLGSDGDVLHGIEPSGVARVTLEWPAQGRRVTTAVVNNVFVVRVPGAGGGNFPPVMVWRAANGRVIRVVTTP